MGKEDIKEKQQKSTTQDKKFKRREGKKKKEEKKIKRETFKKEEKMILLRRVPSGYVYLIQSNTICNQRVKSFRKKRTILKSMWNVIALQLSSPKYSIKAQNFDDEKEKRIYTRNKRN
ncbi:unnamed protein product [Paramecium octaurelia]|uniref:Uncharacterized protein n=1 Tax=Paramecium octaurelia TaxID=43137 RepID=A0A8S1SLY3_PAROT|nr:unnamed protein product [Paramecium octaurelia]